MRDSNAGRGFRRNTFTPRILPSNLLQKRRLGMRGLSLVGVLWFGFFGSFAVAQDSGQPQVVCTVGLCKEIQLPKPRYSEANAFSVQQVWTVVNDILSVSGLSPNFQVVETDEVGNAAAVVIEGERYLAFNPTWIAQYKSDPNGQWQLYGVMAHEVGHHLQGHTITGTGSRPPTELEADEYAGFTLAALGASLGEAQSLWVTLSKEGSPTHPPRFQRLAAVERGWVRRNGQTSGTTPNRPTAQTPNHPPPPGWAMQHCLSVRAVGSPAELCFSSYLAPQSNNTYAPANTRDGLRHTAWVEGVTGQGIGEAITLVLDSPTRINRFRIQNGYGKSDRAYARNSRVRRFQVTASNGQQMTLNLSDTSGWQETDVFQDFGPISWIMLEIDDVFAGSHYQDTAITELGFD